MRKFALAAACLLSLAGCGSTVNQVTAAANTTISKAQADVQTALSVYGVAKGIAGVAATVDPTIAPVVAAAASAIGCRSTRLRRRQTVMKP